MIAAVSPAAAVVWTIVGVLAVALLVRGRLLDRRRLERAEAAGLAAVEDLRRRNAARRRRQVDVRLDLLPRATGAVGWRVWDLEPDFDSGAVEGVLVPYALGEADGLAAAEDAGRRSIAAEPRARLVEVRIRQVVDVDSVTTAADEGTV